MDQKLRDIELSLTLVIDDDLQLLRSLALVLEAHDIPVVTAENGVRGLQAFRNRAPAVVLLDMRMPRLDGLETIAQMRRERPEARIIAMSGEDGEGSYLSAAKRMGACAIIVKPFEPAALVELVRSQLQSAVPEL